MMKKIDTGILDELLKGCERPEDLLGDGGLMKDLKRALMQRMLGRRADRASGLRALARQRRRFRPIAATAPAARR